MFIGSQSILGVRQSKVDEGGYMAEDGVCAFLCGGASRRRCLYVVAFSSVKVFCKMALG